MPTIKFLLAHKKSAIALTAVTLLVAEVVVRPARYVGFKNYIPACKKFKEIRDSDFTEEQKKTMKEAALTYYHENK